MNSGPLLFLGILLSTALSFWGLVIAPAFQIGRQEVVDAYPGARTGAAQRGAEVYRSLGCVECHTQQVRPRGYGTDIDRGWGIRRTVAQDYLRDRPALLGNLRLGPDLANVGARQTDRRWHLQHFYEPKKLVPGSMMPPFKFLFEKRKLSGPAGQVDWVEDGYEIIPTDDANALVAYMLSLKSQAPVLEAPLPPAPTNAVPAEGGTNTPAATNASATNPPAK
jgi:cytochrome c oxidase cbb3-type subunit II